MTTPQYERVAAECIQVGDSVARARTHDFFTVERVVLHPVAVSIFYTTKQGSRFGGQDRPRRTSLWWRRV